MTASFDWLAHNSAAVPVVSSLILAICGILLFYFWQQLHVVDRDVQLLTEFVVKGDIAVIVGAGVPAATRRGAITKLIDDANIKPGAPVARRFVRYCQGLLRSIESFGPAIRTTRSASYVFDPDMIVRESINLRLFLAMPNVLVGLGLLFTFLGLTAALYFATQGSSSGDVGQTQHAIDALLRAATFKFWSSLVALMCSIIFLAVERVQLRRFQKHVLRLVNALDDAFLPITAEEILYLLASGEHLKSAAEAQLQAIEAAAFRILDDTVGAPTEQVQAFLENVDSIRSASQEQALAIQRMSSTIGDAVGRAIGTTLVPRIESTFGRLDETIANIGAKMQVAHIRVLERIVTEFGDRLESHAGDTFKKTLETALAFSTTVSQNVEGLDKCLVSLQEVTEALGTASSEMSLRLREGLESVTATFAGIAEAARRLEEASEPIAKAERAAALTLKRIETVQGDVSRGLLDILEALKTAEASVKASAKGSSTVAKSFERDVGLLVERMDAMFGQAQGVVAVELRGLQESVREASERIATASSVVLASSGESKAFLQFEADRLREALGRVGDSVAAAIERTSGGQNGVAEGGALP